MEADRGSVFERVSEFRDHSMWKWGTPGMVIGVTDREKTLSVSAKGYSDAASRRPLTPDTMFQIGSVSKSFTCIALLQLVEQGALEVHDPVTKHLPWLSISSKHSGITLHHLMTHTAGIILGSDATPTAWTETWDLRHTEATCEPGTFFHYSNSGYKALGLVLETVTGKGYDRIIREGILNAAGMRSTEPVITNGIRGRVAVAHQPTHDDRPSNRESSLSPAPWFEGDTADGSICAPVEDMLTYIRVLLNRGQGQWGRVVLPESFKLMTAPYIATEDGLHGQHYGYGLNTETVDGHSYISHSGGMVGHYTSMVMDMDLGIGVMVMINGPGDADEVARFALKTVRASSEGGNVPGVPSRGDAFMTASAADHVGTFGGPDGTIEITDVNGTLNLGSEGRRYTMEPRERDSFFVGAPGFELFLLEFEMDDGRVVRAHHGEHSYFREGFAPSLGPVPAPGGIRYEGHYRSHNPWLSNFRVVRRSSGRAFVMPHGASYPLVPITGHEFRIGADERSPERIVFDGFVDGVATSAIVSGGGRFGRTSTP
jgi:CubicO group peptidase (beta-lactamase class C family)